MKKENEMGHSQAPGVVEALRWTKEKPVSGGHYHLRELGKNGRTIVFISDDGEEQVTFYNGRREYLGNIRSGSEWAGPIPKPEALQNQQEKK